MTEFEMRWTVLEAEQLPARIPDLRARLAHVDEDRLTHGAWLSVTSRELEGRRANRFLQRGPRGKKLSQLIKSQTLGPPSIQNGSNYRTQIELRESSLPPKSD